MHQLCVAMLVALTAASTWGEDAKDNPVTANIGLASQYVFRGLTQTNGKPAIQGGADYAHTSGWYLGTWFSNISWYTDQNAGTVSAPVALSSPGPLGPPYLPGRTNAARLEWDLYGGFKRQFAGDWSYDLGAIRYLYPGRFDNVGAYRVPNTTEIYGAVGYRWLSAKYSRAISRYTFGVNESTGATYLDLTATVPIADDGVNLVLHVGRQAYPHRSNVGYFGNSGGTNALYSYTDFRIGVTKDWQRFTFGAAWTYAGTKGTAADGQTTAYLSSLGRNIGGSRLLATVTRTF